MTKTDHQIRREIIGKMKAEHMESMDDLRKERALLIHRCNTLRRVIHMRIAKLKEKAKHHYQDHMITSCGCSWCVEISELERVLEETI